MQNSFGTVYKVFIELNEDKMMTAVDVQNFVNDYFGVDMLDEDLEVKNVALNGYSLELIWKVPINEGVHEIENALYYVLKDGRIRSYSWKCLE